MELKAQLHLHTTESRGTRVVTESLIQPKQVIDIAKKSRIDVIAITDHNNTRAYPKVKKYADEKGVLLINGVEISTADGHLIGLDVNVGIEEKLDESMTALEAGDVIKDFGGEVYIPHVFDIRKQGIGDKVKDVDGIIEVFNSLDIYRFEDKYAEIVASKFNRPRAVGADAHVSWMIDRCLTVVDSEPNVQSVLEAIKDGRVRFENCRHMTLREMKELSLERVINSYEFIKNKIKDGWDVDKWYMTLANNPIIKPVEKTTLELGMRTKKSKIWDFVTCVSYLIAYFYGRYNKREFDAFISTL